MNIHQYITSAQIPVPSLIMNFNRLIPELSVVDEVYERIKKAE